jgi:hypothetical protein
MPNLCVPGSSRVIKTFERTNCKTTLTGMKRSRTPLGGSAFISSRATIGRSSPQAVIPAFLVGLALLLLSQLSHAQSIGFENTGSLVQARAGHKATLLPNGKVLVEGGQDSSGAILLTSELFDPAGGTWTPTGSLADFRADHTATLLTNGKVLVTGGLVVRPGDSSLRTAEVYDSAKETWTATGSLTIGRGLHTATVLPDGRVLVAGGYYVNGSYGSLASTEIYDPASGTWALTGDLITKRHVHTATLLPDGKVLVAGGNYGSVGGPTLSSAELFDVATGAWTDTGSLTTGRQSHTATLLPSGKVLVAGGFNGGPLGSAELYDPSSGTWAPTGSLIAARYLHTATLLPSGKVLVTGGEDSTNVVGSAELYDPTSGTWTDTGSLSTSRFLQTATLLSDGKVLIAGGRGGSGVLASAEIFTGPPVPPSLLNISTRLDIQTGDNAMIGGFIVTGYQPKTVIVRALGPSLGMSGALADPVIEVHDGLGQLVAMNDNWNDATTRQQIIDSGLAPTNDLESALWGIISPGAYTVVVRGSHGEVGTGLFEVYDLDTTAVSRLGNISTRGLVQSGNDVLIGGFISGAGDDTGTVALLIRALGPSISAPGALTDPALDFYDGNGSLIESNDNWKLRTDGTSQQAEIEATTIPPTNELESAILTTVGAGSYTAIVRGKNDGIGIGLVEVYRLQ